MPAAVAGVEAALRCRAVIACVELWMCMRGKRGRGLEGIRRGDGLCRAWRGQPGPALDWKNRFGRESRHLSGAEIQWLGVDNVRP